MKTLRSMLVLVVLVSLVFTINTYAQEPIALEPGLPQERSISGGQTHTYRIKLQAGQFVQFNVQQVSCDVTLTLRMPDGKAREMNATPLGHPEILSAEVTTTGDYQLALRSVDYPKMSGQFRLQANVKASADESDKKRLQAEQLLIELRGNIQPMQRLEKARKLLSIWQELHEQFWMGYAHNLLANAYFQQQMIPQALSEGEKSLAIMRELKFRIGEANVLSNLASYQQRAGQNDKAIATAQQSLVLAQEANAQVLVAGISGTLGDFYFSKSQWTQALEFYEQAHTIRTTIGNTASEAGYFNVRAMIAMRQNKHDDAKQNFETALSKAQSTNNKFMISFIYLNLGDLASARNHFDDAVANYEKGLSQARESNNRQQELNALLKLATLHKYKGTETEKNKANLAALPIARELKLYVTIGNILGNLGDGAENNEKRLAYYEEALEVSRIAGNKAQQADNLQGICGVLMRLGNVEKAITSCEQSLPLARETKSIATESFALRNLGDAYARLFQYDKALQYFQEALQVGQKQKDRKGEDAAYTALAQLHFFLGQNDKALEFLDKALQVPSVKGTSFEAISLQLKGKIYALQNEPQQALQEHEKLIEFTKRLTPDSVAVGITNLELGRDYLSLGQYEKAQSYFEAAAQLFTRVNERVFLQEVQLGVGDVWLAMKQYDKAITSHQQALLLSRQYPTGMPYEAPYHEQLMKDWKLQGNIPLAIFYGKQAVNSNQEIRFNLQNLEQGLQQSFLKSKEQTYRELADLLISQGRLPEAEQVIRMLKEEEYFDYVRRDGKNGAKTEKAVLNATEAALEKRYREIADSLTALGAERNALLEKKERTVAEEQRLNKLEADLRVAEQIFQNFLNQLSTELRVKKGTESNVVQINASEAFMDDLRELGKGTVALYTVVTDERFHVILTTSDVRRSYSYAIKGADLNRKVLSFRAALQNPKVDPLPLAQELYKIIVAPLAKDLRAAKAETLMWSLDGVLRYMPIAALHDGEKYLVERWRNVVFTTASKARLKDDPSRQWNALGLGVTKSHGERIPALPAVADEMHSIIREANSQTGVLPGTIKLDEQFTQEAMLTELRRRPPVVHVASHFDFKPGTETDSALLLGDGKFLSLAEIKTMTNVFSGVELLTLSACNTATGGNDATGKEIEGFGMLAQNKGAKAVVASLWPVADRSTKELMRAFYQLREAKTGTTKAEALQQAQRQLMNGETVATIDLKSREIVHESDKTTNLPKFKVDPKHPYAHPYYWAPFILIGNWK